MMSPVAQQYAGKVDLADPLELRLSKAIHSGEAGARQRRQTCWWWPAETERHQPRKDSRDYSLGSCQRPQRRLPAGRTFLRKEMSPKRSEAYRAAMVHGGHPLNCHL